MFLFSAMMFLSHVEHVPILKSSTNIKVWISQSVTSLACVSIISQTS